ncbi:MAG: hypothetical protein K8J31_08160 [Anaerolineae bacterium]|nr:hypothetical protein [Anaerolineae bacterium]
MNPIAINQYAQDRHQEIVREAEAYWKAELARTGADVLPPETLKQTRTPLKRVAQLLTALIR